MLQVQASDLKVDEILKTRGLVLMCEATIASTTDAGSPTLSSSTKSSMAGVSATVKAMAPIITKAPTWIMGGGAAAIACLAF